jgi:hypothetical protein
MYLGYRLRNQTPNFGQVIQNPARLSEELFNQFMICRADAWVRIFLDGCRMFKPYDVRSKSPNAVFRAPTSRESIEEAE